jgi:hypothetical protein
MAAKFLDRPDITPGKVQGFSDGCMPEPVRPHSQAGFCAQISHNVIEAGTGQRLFPFLARFMETNKGPTDRLYYPEGFSIVLGVKSQMLTEMSLGAEFSGSERASEFLHHTG